MEMWNVDAGWSRGCKDPSKQKSVKTKIFLSLLCSYPLTMNNFKKFLHRIVVFGVTAQLVTSLSASTVL
jgi:hypothetical protein